MVDVTYFNMLLNIGLLVLIAALLTNLEFVRTLFLEEQSSIFSKTALGGDLWYHQYRIYIHRDVHRWGDHQYPCDWCTGSRTFRWTLCGDVNSTDRRYSSISV